MLGKFVRSMLNRSTNDTRVRHEQRKYESVWKENQYREFSPGQRAFHVFKLVDRLREAGVWSVLDAGCGSGKLMKALIETPGETFNVRGFDIAGNCLDPYFRGREREFLDIGCLWDDKAMTRIFDAVICVDVLEHIPTDKIPDVLSNLRRCARKYCYLGIALHHDHYGPKLLGEPLHLTVQEPNWWLAALLRAGFPESKDVHIESDSGGQPLWLHVFIILNKKFDSV